jgi:preprotein translocase subunit YajC
MGSMWLLADTNEWLTMLPPVLLIGLLGYLMLWRPERRKQSVHQSMLDNLKPNDRVVTIGGIRGTVVRVRREADEVTVKVDDNTKLRMTMASIARVETGEAGEEKTTG